MELTESSWSRPILLTDDQATSLQELGRDLVSRSNWALRWSRDGVDPEESGEQDVSDDGPDVAGDANVDLSGQMGRSAIWCRPLGGGKWQVRVPDRVGQISIGDLKVTVVPKIDLGHFTHLIGQGAFNSQLTTSRLARSASTTVGFWEVLARLYITSVKELLRADLFRDYLETEETVPFVRGRVDVLRTTRLAFGGVLQIHARFDEFSLDTPLNRVIRGATSAVAGSDLLGEDLRREARMLRGQMEGVGELRASDASASQLDRRVAHYGEALEFAKVILAASAGSWLSGGAKSSAWLLRTPDLIESGIRQVLKSRLAPDLPVWKSRGGKRLVSPPGETINPDLVFGLPAIAVGDVKYVLTDPQGWSRSHVYEVVSFAVAYNVARGAIVDLSATGTSHPDFIIGDRRVRHLPWRLSLPPDEAQHQLETATEEWLASGDTFDLASGSNRELIRADR